MFLCYPGYGRRSADRGSRVTLVMVAEALIEVLVSAMIANRPSALRSYTAKFGTRSAVLPIMISPEISPGKKSIASLFCFSLLEIYLKDAEVNYYHDADHTTSGNGIHSFFKDGGAIVDAATIIKHLLGEFGVELHDVVDKDGVVIWLNNRVRDMSTVM